jgi:hypothetical protein
MMDNPGRVELRPGLLADFCNPSTSEAPPGVNLNSVVFPLQT